MGGEAEGEQKPEAEGVQKPEVQGVEKKEVGIPELEGLDASLDQVVEFVQCICWAFRSVYGTESPWITVYTKLKESLLPEACAFKQGVLPLTLAIVTGLATFLNDEYLDIELNVWRRRLDKIVEGAVEQQKLFWCLAWYYRYLASEVKGRADAVKDILSTVLFEARQFEKSRKIVHMTSNVREEVWVPLLFVPYVGCFATPFAVKNEDSSMSKRVCAKTEGESAVAAAYSQTDTLVPALEKVAESLDSISGFFSLLLPPLEKLSTSPNREDPVWEERTQYQLEMIKERAFRFRMKCLDLVSLQTTMEFTLEPVPNMTDDVVDEYVKEWLSAKKAPAELQLTLHIVSARGLPTVDAAEGIPTMGGADPYCVCMIPSKKRSTIKTRVIRDNANPIWNFEGKVPDYAAGDSLEFKIFDKEYGKADALLASALLSSTEFYPDGFSGDLKLTPAIGDSNQTLLRLKIRVTDAKSEGDQAVGVLLADKMRDATESPDVVWALEP